MFKRGFAIFIMLMAIAGLVGCKTSARFEELDVASRTRIFWHPQGDGLALGLGIRDLGGSRAELSVHVRNDGRLPMMVPVPGPETVAFMVDDRKVSIAAAGLENDLEGSAAELASGERRSHVVLHDFGRGRVYRVYGSLLTPGSPGQLVTPEVRLSAVFGSPMDAYFSSWNESP